MKRTLILFLLLHSVSMAQVPKWIQSKPCVDAANALVPNATNNLQFYEVNFTTTTPVFTQRIEGSTLTGITTRGVSELINNGVDANGNINFYVFAHSSTPFNTNSTDNINFVAFDPNTGADEIFATIPGNNTTASSVRNIEVVPVDGSPNFYYIIYKTACINNLNPDEINYVTLNMNTKTISAPTLLSSNNHNEGMGISRRDCTTGERWLFFTKLTAGTFTVFRSKINASGISAPVSATTQTLTNVNSLGQGDLEISPDGTRLAIALMNNTTTAAATTDVMLFDLNNTTGALTNYRSIDNPNAGHIISLEFSPNSQRLYMVQGGATGVTQALFNLAVPSLNYTIVPSTDQVPVTLNPGGISLELAYNGFLYFNSGGYVDHLSYINNPNANALTNTVLQTATNSYGAGNASGNSFPDQIDGDLLTPIDPLSITASNNDTICSGQNTTLTVTGGGAVTYSWSPATGLNTTTGASVIASPTSTQTYTVTATVNGCVVSKSITIKVENCCFAASDPAFTTISSDPNYLTHTVLSGKYYVAPNVIITVNATTLDLTNVDIVFDECSGINFVNNAKVIAYNSVFRTCEETKSWLGFSFSASSGNISESTFKNAQKAIKLEKGSSVRITNNNFLNDQISVYQFDNIQSEAISGNQFTTNNQIVNYETCNNSFVNTDIYSIWSRKGTFNDIISQNNFVNADYQNTKRVYGIYLIEGSANANISSNIFSNQYTSIYASGSNNLAVQNNQVELTGLYTYPGIPGEDIQFYFLKGTNNVTLSGNTLKGKQLYSNYGIYLDGISRMFLNGNDLKHFNTSIHLNRSSNVEVVNNQIENTTTGIYSNSSTDSYFGCNVINCLNTNSTGISFEQTTEPNSLCKIIGNCIYNSYTAISLFKSTASGSNTMPYIANNFLYSYRKFGVLNTNFNGNLGSGLTGLTAGKNSFSSNNVSGGAADISTNTPLTSYGNFGITNISSSVTLVGNNTFYSTASCGNQLGNANTQFSNDDICLNSGVQSLPKVVSANGSLTSEFEAMSESLKREEKTAVLQLIASQIASSTTTGDMIRIQNLVNGSDLSDNDKSLVLAKLYCKQPAISLNYLESIIGMEDLVNIEKANLYTLSSEMTNVQFNELMNIQESASENREQAREALNAYSGNYPYRLKKKSTANSGEENNGLISVDQNDLMIFPNPAQDLVSFQVSMPSNEESTLQITDLSGKIIASFVINEDFRLIEFNVSNLRAGIYIVSIQQQNKPVITKKMSVLH